MMIAQTPDDKVKIEEYRKTLGKYPKPSVTADIVAVRPAYSELGEGQWRENPQFSLEVLFIKRGQWPFEGSWALPGGFIRPTETVDEGAKRELREETALEAVRLIPVGVFSKPDRDMRAWIISNAFVSVHKRGQGCHVKGGDDAREARWLTVKSPTIGYGRFYLPFYDAGKLAFSLTGTYREEDLGGGTVMSVDDNPLAFDHAQIIVQAFLRMLSFDIKRLVFFFLPEKFTLSNYIDVYQYLTRHSVSAANIPSFRRQLTATKDPLLEVCEGEWEDLGGRAHAPAKLYRRKTAS
ncbi:MAG: NUDIX domain-containing protein [Kiritimatiellia bacterium]